jgi:cob(I)alamin adenosyltransferase
MDALNRGIARSFEMRITKVYTKVGDKGTTRLVGGREVSKGEPRVEAYGTVDELNAVVGLARTFNGTSGATPNVVIRINDMLGTIQNSLFCLGSELATRVEDRWEGMEQVSEEDVAQLEAWIDELNGELPPLKEFILPGGGPVGAFLHQARTVCRRAERVLVRLGEDEPEAIKTTLPYLNRLSDYFFVLGRWAAKGLGEPEYLWQR